MTSASEVAEIVTVLTEYQRETLRALIDRIIPADDFPGGWEAGVGDYLDRQFAADLRPLIEMYRAGLDALAHEARATAGSDFARVAPDAQDEVLRRVEAGDVATEWSVDPSEFFRTVVEHAAEGYYGDPGNGGNRDGVSWQMIGFEVTG